METLSRRTLLKGAATSVLPVAAAAAGDPLQDSFIWATPEQAPPGKQVYAAFRKAFNLAEQVSAAGLRIFADNRYLLWINGRYVERGPCRFDPKRPEYDVLAVQKYLRAGRNAIAVLVHYYAVGSFREWWEQCARMMEHEPGLTLRLDSDRIALSTDRTWRVNTRTAHLPSPGSYSSVPDVIDARLDPGDWTQPEFDDSSWPTAVPVSGSKWGRLYPRSIPLLKETAVTPQMADLPADLKVGNSLVLDLGKAYQVYSLLELEADAGSEIVVQHGLKESSNKERISRYVARDGRQTFLSTDTHGVRGISVTLKSGRARLITVKVTDRRYPYSRLGRFQSSDPLLNKLWELGVNTVELCSEDAYVDCADRERAQWIADGYMMSYPVSCVALAGPGPRPGTYTRMDGRLLKNMLRHMAFSQLPDGRLQPMRPSIYSAEGRHGVIDDYTCLWVQAVRELHARGGDTAFLRELWPVMVKAVDYFLNRRTSRGLVHAREFIYFNNPLAYKTCEGASVNCYIHKALLDAAQLGVVVGDSSTSARFQSAARDLNRAINEHLWDEETGSYHGGILEDVKSAPTGHAATLALFFDIVPGGRIERVRQFMRRRFEAESPFPYTYRYYFDALYKENTEEADRLVLEAMRRKWERMTRSDTGAAWETFRGASYMHESGAHPAYFLSAFVLGVRTEPAPGGPRLTIEPRLGELASAEGVVLTEYGPVPVSWQRHSSPQSLAFRLTVPRGATADVSVPRIPADSTVTVNGREISGVAHGRFLTFQLEPGVYSGRI
jgi:alpha-L-rhamnosidase